MFVPLSAIVGQPQGSAETEGSQILRVENSASYDGFLRHFMLTYIKRYEQKSVIYKTTRVQ